MAAGYVPVYGAGDIIRFEKQKYMQEPEPVHFLIEAVSSDLMGQFWYYVFEFETGMFYSVDSWTVDNTSVYVKVA